MSSREANREKHTINKELWGDYTGNGPWFLNGEEYEKVHKERIDGDGEWWRVIVKRKSDDKHFGFEWGEGSFEYYFEEDLIEVFPKTITTIKYE